MKIPPDSRRDESCAAHLLHSGTSLMFSKCPNKFLSSSLFFHTVGLILESKLFMHSPQCTAALCTAGFRQNPAPVTKVAFNLYTVLQQYHEDGARIEAAFRRYIHRADPKQKEDSYEIIVCHANVIRYFVCRFVLLADSGLVALRTIWAKCHRLIVS